MESDSSPMRLVVDNRSPRPAMKGLYLITDQGDRLPERVLEALDGGISYLQYRNKERDFDRKLNEGWELRQLCREREVTFIVNDDLRLARELDADGIHLGQEDGSVVETRRVLGKGKLIGVSTHNLDEALRAEAEGADYIGFGAIYPTSSKDVDHMPGPEGLAAVRGRVRLPVVAIGGISRDNAPRVIDAGADALAVISAVLGNSSPALAANELSLLFNRKAPLPRGVVLTVAGSDSGGGAGIQADLKTITLLGSYGASVITALTAQNTRGVSAIHPVPADFVGEQMNAVFSDLPVDVVKTGMLLSAGIIDSLAEKLTEYGRRLVVVDPVMVAKGGANLLDRNALDAFRDRLLPLSYLLTPNIPEAEKLTGLTIRNEEDMEAAARALVGMGARNVLVKGGHLTSGDSTDLLFDGGGFSRFSAPRILTRNTHGTGCTFASAIAALLAQGEPLPRAVAGAKAFITSAIRLAHPLGKGHGPVNHYLAAREPGIR
jgi:hydroxymethylpyrimidine kinase / phosphomethylpyrimidine kinase / thiamine-phosphate diphosphorylase